jgi:hypothetical protein
MFMLPPRFENTVSSISEYYEIRKLMLTPNTANLTTPPLVGRMALDFTHEEQHMSKELEKRWHHGTLALPPKSVDLLRKNLLRALDLHTSELTILYALPRKSVRIPDGREEVIFRVLTNDMEQFVATVKEIAFET